MSSIKNFYLIIILIILGFSLKAQNKHILDSLMLKYETTNISIHSPRLFDSIYSELGKGDNSKLLSFTKGHLTKVHTISDQKRITKAFRATSSCFTSENQKDSAMYYAEKAMNLSKELKDEFEIAKSKQSIAAVHNILMEYDIASQLLYESLNYFEKNGKPKDYASILYKLASFNSQIGSLNNALEFFNKALKLYEELEDREAIAEIYYQIGSIHLNSRDYDKARLFYEKSVELSEELYHNIMLSANYFSLSGMSDMMDDTIKSLYYINKAIEIDIKLDSKYGLTYDYLQLGNYYVRVDSLEKAKETIDMAYKYSLEIGQFDIVITCLSMLSNIEYSIQNYKASADHQKKINYFYDSINKLYDPEKLLNTEKQYRLTQQEQEYLIKEERAKFKNFMIIAGISALMVIGFLLYFLARVKMKQVAMEKQKLQEELSYKNKQLTTNVLYLVNKNELIASISKKLVQLRITSVKQENKQILSELVSEIQHNLDDELWKEFEVRFQEVHSDFYNKLNDEFPELTVNERRLAAFLRLNMTTKEISSITHQSNAAIEMARSRLRKKLNINSTDVNLVSYFAQF